MDLVVEGNIGAGKSTVLRYASEYPDEKLDIHLEPVDVWIKLGIIKAYYNDPRKYATTFQSVAFATHFSIAAQPRVPNHTRVLERSIAANKIIFAAAQYELGNMDDTEWNAYNYWYDAITSKFTDVLNANVIIYLRASPETCMRRINTRDREAETSISLDYIQLLHNKYEAWLMSPEMRDRVHVIDVDKDWESEEQYRTYVHDELRKAIKSIRSSRC